MMNNETLYMRDRTIAYLFPGAMVRILIRILTKRTSAKTVIHSDTNTNRFIILECLLLFCLSFPEDAPIPFLEPAHSFPVYALIS